MRTNEFDVVIATDLRFPGGSSASTLEEIGVNAGAGWRSGLYHLPSTVLKRRRPFHPGLLGAIFGGQAELLNLAQGRISTRILMVRHPGTIPHDGGPLPEIDADTVILVVNHPPINAAGRIDYLLPHAIERLRRAYGREPQVHPIGPLVRSALIEYYNQTVPLAPADWANVFDLGRFGRGGARSPRSADVLRIGRHSRPGREKWPDDPAALRAAYPDAPDLEVVVMGGADAPKEVMGALPPNWTVHPFGAMPPEAFLDEIDVFVYFHHPQWVEAFGRAIAEAMAAGLPTILPPHFAALFEEGAIYAEPEEVGDHLRALRRHDVYRRWSQAARGLVERKFSHEVHVDRLKRLGLAREAAHAV